MKHKTRRCQVIYQTRDNKGSQGRLDLWWNILSCCGASSFESFVIEGKK
jgi:hypothetical protein